jgi:MFS family permease
MSPEAEQENSPDQPKAEPAKALYTVRQSIFWISLPFGILGFVLPIYGKEIGAGALQIGLFFSVFFFMTVILRPLVGTWLDRIGRRTFFVAGLAVYTLSMTAFAFSEQTWTILLARGLQGVASACMWLAAQAITADVASEAERGRSFGSLGQSSSQGQILGTFIGFGVLVQMGMRSGWRLLFLGFACAGVLATVFAWRRLKETRPAVQRSENHPIRWTRNWNLLLLVTLVTGAAVAMLEPVMMIFLQEKFTQDVAMLALAFLPAGLVWALLPSRLGRLADRLGRKPLMVLGMAVAAMSSFLIPGLGSLVLLAGLWALQALCYAAGDPAEQALVADLTGGDQRGRAYGYYAMAAGIGATFGPLAGGWLYQSVGASAPFFANGVVLGICTLVLAIFLQEPAKQSFVPYAE